MITPKSFQNLSAIMASQGGSFNPVLLGFVEDVTNEFLVSDFQSKVGGKPVIYFVNIFLCDFK